jgi:hypothetical protein
MISLLVPTRNRVRSVVSLIKSIHDTAESLDNIEFCFYIDDDDSNSISFFENLPDDEEFKNIKCIIDKQILLSETYNEMYKVAEGDIIMYAADDIKFNTKNWDTIVENKFKEFEDGAALVFGFDGIQAPGHLATHGFVHRKLIDLLEYVLPPYFGADYADHWMTEIYSQVGRKIFVDLDIEHMHYSKGKTPIDETYLSSALTRSQSQQTYSLEEMIDKRKSDINKIRTYISNFKKEDE